MPKIEIHSLLPDDYSDEYKNFYFDHITIPRDRDHKDVDALDEDFTAAITAEHERAFKHGFQTAVKILGGNFEAFLND